MMLRKKNKGVKSEYRRRQKRLGLDSAIMSKNKADDTNLRLQNLQTSFAQPQYY